MAMTNAAAALVRFVNASYNAGRAGTRDLCHGRGVHSAVQQHFSDAGAEVLEAPFKACFAPGCKHELPWSARAVWAYGQGSARSPW